MQRKVSGQLPLLVLLTATIAACGPSARQEQAAETPPEPPEQEPAERQTGDPSATDAALEEVKRLYEEALKYAPEDPVKWTKEDLKKIGDWQYRVVQLEKSDAAQIEAQLNEFGADRWEVFWISESRSELTVYMKKPARSYLRMVPLSDVSRFFGGSTPEGGH